MRYRLNNLDEPVFIAVSKPLPTEFGIHHRLESCDDLIKGVCSYFLETIPSSLQQTKGPSIEDVPKCCQSLTPSPPLSYISLIK